MTPTKASSDPTWPFIIHLAAETCAALLLRIAFAAGSNLAIVRNSSGMFVRGAVNSARIVRTDILASQGVMHVIDTLLLLPGL